MTDRSKLLAEASNATERLMDFITDKPDWQIPQPKAVISLETAAAFAMVYAKERADAEAAAMRERAALACEDRAKTFLSPKYATGQPLSSMMERFACGQCAEAIRALPATGEVGRG